MKHFLNSKKTKGLIVGMVAEIIAASLTKYGLDEATAADLMQWIAGIVCTYIGAQGYADGQSRGATSANGR